jgi:hypothetical protein
MARAVREWLRYITGRVTAPSAAEETSAAYLAMTPVS